ncbi:MAG: AAA family ATPase [Oryzihumus sp.]
MGITNMVAYQTATTVKRAARGKHALAAIAPKNTFDVTSYPGSFEEYTGQELAKRQLSAGIIRAKREGRRLRHTLITSGVPGVGKTGLAVAIAGELGTDIVAVSGKITVKDIRPTLLSMSAGDVLFVDEIHLMVAGGKASAEWLLPFLQDGVLMGPSGAEPMPDVTVVAATTDAGKLPETILSRFKIRCQLQPYTREEAGRICSLMAFRSAQRDGTEMIPDDVIDAIVEASAHNPRIMGNLLESYSDLAYTSDNPDFAEVLEWQGLTPDGLDRTAQRVLVALVSEFDGMAGESALKGRLREPGGLHFAERVLQEKGLIQFTDRGRAITVPGALRAVELQRDGVVV